MPALPATRRLSWQLYADWQADAERRGGPAWYEAERWLGRNDLFYLMVRLLRREDINRDWLFDRCREIEVERDGYLDLWAREHGKMQRLDEPTPTPGGWVAHGDLLPGDVVFGADGSPVRVLAIGPVYSDLPCYEIEFDDGTTIECGGDHLWAVERRTRKRVLGSWKLDGVGKRLYRETVVLRTEEIEAHGHAADRRLAVAVNEPLVLPDADLLIDPYVLGCWLGDGTTTSGSITCGDPELFERIRSRGYEVGPDKTPSRNSEYRLIVGLQAKLRKLGVLRDKHIPAVYLRASIDQRLELLRGLMDTDGTCDTRGTASFANINSDVALGASELCNTLGMKPRFRRKAGFYNGLPYASYEVAFQAYEGLCPFGLKRKADRCKPLERKNARRFIVGCRRIKPSPMRCIQVEASDGLYLTSTSMVPTHNSSLITFGLTVQDILRDPEITVGIFSHTRPIAKGFLSQIKREFEDNAYLKALYADVLWDAPHKEAPKWSEDGGLIVRRLGNPKESTVEAWGLVDGQPTGRHFQLRVYDDVVTRESVTTPEQIDKTTKAWELSDNLGVQSDQGGRSRHIGTRYHLNDTYSVILERDAAKARFYPATHNGRFEGRPVLFSQAEWERRLKTQSRATVSAQLLQNPLADESAVFRTEWLKSYEVRPRTLNVYIMCDPSRGRSATSDNTAIAVVGVATNGARYLLDGLCHRMTLSQRWTNLKTLYRKWARTKGVQHIAVGYERYGAQSDDEYFQEQMDIDARKGIADAHFTIAELNWPRDGTESKRERVERLEPDFRNGRFFLPLPVLRGGKPSIWSVDANPDSKTFRDIHYRDVGGLSRQQMAVVEGGSADLIAKAIKGVDQDGHVYDLTILFFQEYESFPFGARKDLIDATSRLYDMEPRGPVIVTQAMTEEPVYWDS